MKWRFASGMTDYGASTESIISYSQHIGFDGSFKRRNNHMDFFLLEQKCGDESWDSWLADATGTETAAFYEGVAAGLQAEDPYAPGKIYDQDRPLDALFKKGKGKGNKGE